MWTYNLHYSRVDQQRYSDKDCFSNTNLLAVKTLPRCSLSIINSTENMPVKQPENEGKWKFES